MKNIFPMRSETALRFADVAPSSYDKDARTVEAIISLGSPVQRWYGTEKLRIATNAVVLDRMSSSGIPLLDSHNQAGIDNVLGRFVQVFIGRHNSEPALIGRIAFADTERGRQAEGMVERGEIKGISAGYQVREWEITDKDGRVLDPEVDRIRFDEELTFEATRWELLEGSLVSVPADAPAMIRSMSFGTGQDLASPIGQAAEVRAILARMQARQQMIDRMLIEPDATSVPFEEIQTSLTDSSDRTIPNKENAMNVHITRDARESTNAALELAITNRILSGRGRRFAIEYEPLDLQQRTWADQHRDHARQFQNMSLTEMAAQLSDYRSPSRLITPRDAPAIFERAFNTTSDFPSIFMNAVNKALLARYELQTPTYREIAGERTFTDFRPHPQVRAGDFPMLQEVKETGELQYGSSTDNNEPISVKAYGIVFPITRQMLVNDELGAIDQMLSNAGDMVLVFENTTFWNMFKSNPVLNQDGLAVFHATHGNLAASGADPSVTTIGAGRQAIRQMTNISGNLINVPPSIILTGPAQETNADQIVASITPTLTTSVNPFSGRLRSVSEANITDNSWYLLADPTRVPAFIYGFLAGSGGPRIRTHEPFGIQGVKVSLEHDFGVGAIDFRGVYKVPAH